MRQWRKDHPLNAEQKIKDRARAMANVYKSRGRLTEEPCRVCGANAQMHHQDYSKPLEVVWLCRKHHLAEHKRLDIEAAAAAIPAILDRMKRKRLAAVAEQPYLNNAT